MNHIDSPPKQTAFQSLSPDTVINVAEKALSIPCTNLCRPLNSYINRVYELESVEGQGLIAKFYRPGRWSAAGLQDEHDYLNELAAQEIPVVVPLKLQNNQTLDKHGNIFFTIFPKKGGRSFDEYNDDQWLELGRLLGRVHNVGALHKPKDRITMLPEISTRQQTQHILNCGYIPSDLATQFSQLAETIIEETKPLFTNSETIRIHGDCHFANLIYRPDESFFIIDLDDMANGPPVQDFWMLLPGYSEDSLEEIDLFLEGYETFRNFDRNSLRLIEPLRAMRYIHYISWCAHQVIEDGHSIIATDFKSREYWQREINDLADQLTRIHSAPQLSGNC